MVKVLYGSLNEGGANLRPQAWRQRMPARQLESGRHPYATAALSMPHPAAGNGEEMAPRLTGPAPAGRDGARPYT